MTIEIRQSKPATESSVFRALSERERESIHAERVSSMGRTSAEHARRNDAVEASHARLDRVIAKFETLNRPWRP